eukprot:8429-Karenia_brevis.AAC.1
MHSHLNGTLQIQTHKFRGLGVIRCEKALKQLHEALTDCLKNLQCSAGQPQLGRATAFCCPHGHQKAACSPFDVMHPGKQ